VIPQLPTERLVLRGWEPGDAAPYAALAADPAVMRFLGGPVAPPVAWRGLAMHAGHWVLRGYGNWAVERRGDGVLLGRCGLWEPEGWFGLELGWVLARHAWGQGYAAEAARAAMEWAWRTLDAPALISVIAPDNARSIRVAERLGMAPVRDAAVGEAPVRIFGVDRPHRVQRSQRESDGDPAGGGRRP
jgi:RimJ/RimL family protein N-acetyltransferase